MSKQGHQDEWIHLFEGWPKSEKKRKQHYVWKHYLRAWANRHNKLYCVQEGRGPFQADLENVAYATDFYRLKEMSEADLRHVERVLLRPMTEEVRRVVTTTWLPPFTEFFRAKKIYEEGGVRIPRMEEELDTMINNLEEDLHAGVERLGLPMLASLRTGDWSKYKDDSALYFFLMMQHWRTPGIAAGGIAALSQIPGFNVDVSWGFIRTILATSSSASLWYRRDLVRVSFLTSTTGFITADMPMTNLRAPAEGEPSEFALYYPLSPTRAVIFDFNATSPGTEHRELTAVETTTYNWMLARRSWKQLYGASKQALNDARIGP